MDTRGTVLGFRGSSIDNNYTMLSFLAKKELGGMIDNNMANVYILDSLLH